MDKKCTVVFNPVAWAKMWMLVDYFNSEVAWNALCRRSDHDDSVFLVDDVLVHKQKVTGGTVRTDPAEYDEWLGAFDDETFAKIRLHGHSHYQCFASPSPLDTELQEDIISQLSGDMFYIFMIINRRRQMWLRVVDKKTDVDAEGADVSWNVKDDSMDLGVFLQVSKPLVEVCPIKTMTYKELRKINTLTKKNKVGGKKSGSSKKLRSVSAGEAD